MAIRRQLGDLEVNDDLIKEARENGGKLKLDYSNPVHFDHILRTLGIEDNGRKSLKDQASDKINELMKIIQLQKAIDKKRNSTLRNRVSGENNPHEIDKNRDRFYIMSPWCEKKEPGNRLLKSNPGAAETLNTQLVTKSVAEYMETKAGMVVDIKMRDNDTGKIIASNGNSGKYCRTLTANIQGDYDKFKGEKEKHVTNIGTIHLFKENDQKELVMDSEFFVSENYNIMGDDAFINEFKVMDPAIKRIPVPVSKKIIVSYNRNSQLNVFDYSIINGPVNNRIELMLPVSFAITTQPGYTLQGLDYNKGFRLFFDNPYGGQNNYCNNIDDSVIKFDLIDGQRRKMTVNLPESWNTVLDFTNLENKISVDMRIYGEFNVLVKIENMGITTSLCVSFKTGSPEEIEDDRNKIIPPIYMQWGCIGEGTLIPIFNTSTNTTNLTSIQKIQIGDVVISTCGKKRIVKNIVTGNDKHIWNIVTEHHKIQLSSRHSICTDRGWISVADIRSDDLIKTEEGYEKLSQFDYVEYDAMVYNLIFCEETTFYGNGISIGDFNMQQRIKMNTEDKVEFSETTKKVIDELMSILPY